MGLQIPTGSQFRVRASPAGLLVSVMMHKLRFRKATSPSLHLSPLLGSLEFLLDFLQGRVTTLRHGGVQIWHAVKGGGLENDLEGLARCPLIQFNHLHIFDGAPAQVHCICGVGLWPCFRLIERLHVHIVSQ